MSFILLLYFTLILLSVRSLMSSVLKTDRIPLIYSWAKKKILFSGLLLFVFRHLMQTCFAFTCDSSWLEHTERHSKALLNESMHSELHFIKKVVSMHASAYFQTLFFFLLPSTTFFFFLFLSYSTIQSFMVVVKKLYSITAASATNLFKNHTWETPEIIWQVDRTPVLFLCLESGSEGTGTWASIV